MKVISPFELKQGIDSSTIALLDIREPWEYAICNIGGLHVVMDQVPKYSFQVDSNKQVCVVCKTGKRAEAVANLLNHRYPEIEFVILEGGITAWFATFEPSYEMY